MPHSFKVLEVDYSCPSAAVEFTQSLHETGFAVLKNHPISERTLARALGEWKTFFSQSDERKEPYGYNPKTMIGHYPYGIENAKGSDFKNKMEYYHHNITSGSPDFRIPFTNTLYAKLYAMGKTLMKWLDQTMPPAVRDGLSCSLTDMMSEAVPLTVMRILHYPGFSAPSAHPTVLNVDHEDINLMTLLCNATEPGLQVKDNQGNWHNVCYNDQSIVFNGGDMLQAATGGYFPSTTHRVIRPAHSINSRYSIPLFIGAKEDIYLTPSLRAGDYFIERMKENGVYKNEEAV